MDTETFDVLADAVFELRGVSILLDNLASGLSQESSPVASRDALYLLSKNVIQVVASIDTILKAQTKTE